MASALDLAAFRTAALCRDPFDYVIVPGFIKQEARAAILTDYPRVAKPGSFPAQELHYGPAFRALLTELNGPAMRQAFEEKFAIDLSGRPTMITVRGRCWEKDGHIHTDTPSKIITVLLYMNPSWEQSGGRLRLLRSATDLDDVAVEVPPVEGTLLAFRRSDNSWHGHKPFVGERRVVQFNWVTDAAVVRREIMKHRWSALVKKLLPFGRWAILRRHAEAGSLRKQAR
ncbi:MAG TPA: 2OG-Fe(II) oxygenase [Gemmataceae bacterium]|nr:2OG-Fe(II) oxygenase [Gemmataceae bacterium]